MNLWRCSVDELAVRRRLRGECERGQEALSQVTSCFQQLAASLGSATDSCFLRDDMEETRVLAHRICAGLSSVAKDIMNLWRCSVDELAVRRRLRGECERGQEALSQVTSCFQQLAASLGSATDSCFLRDDMEETRVLAHRICAGLSQRLLRLLSDCDTSVVEDRQVLERLWVLFLSALENFLSDLRKACSLIGQFPVKQQYDRRSLVNTGCVDGMVGVVARVASVQIPWLTLEENPSPDLLDHIAGLDAMLMEMQLRVPVAFWSVEATQPPWVEAVSEVEERYQSLEDLMEQEVVSDLVMCFQLSCCGVGCEVEEGR